MEKIKIQVLGPVGDLNGELEMDWPADQLDRFLASNRIVVLSNEEPVNFVSKAHRWPNMKKDED